jgi:hypothetical protein
MAPTEFNALLDRWYAEQERQDLRSGILAAIVANLFLQKGRTAFKPVDFMAHKGQHSGVPGGKQIQKVPWQRQLQAVERLNIIFKGKDLRGVHNATGEGAK